MVSKLRSAVSATAKYAISIVVLSIILPDLITSVSKLYLVSDILSFLLLPLIIAYVGRILQILGLIISGIFAKVILAVTIYEYLFLTLLLSLIGSFFHYKNIGSFLLPTLLLMLSISTAIFGVRILDDGKHVGAGSYFTHSSKFVFSLSVALFFYNFPYVVYIAPVFVAISIAGFLVSTWTFFYSSKRENLSSFARYLKFHGGRWISIAAAIAFVYSIIAIPKPSYYNNIIIIAFLVIIALAIIYLVMKLYVLTSRFVERITYKSYKKFEYSDEVVVNPEMNFLIDAIKQFILKGTSASLLIALSTILSRGEKNFTEIEHILLPITSYTKPSWEDYSLLNARKLIEYDMSIRKNVVQSVISKISNQEENVKWKQQQNPVQS